jgi:catechol 2,3-dioxygenase-like lactoylglutathione lyase family enzyme
MRVIGVSVMVLVNDLDRAVRFYRDRLGFVVLNETESWAVLDHGFGLMIAPEPLPEDGVSLNAVMPTIEVDDVDAAFALLTARGVAFLVPPTDVAGATVASFRDSEGNLLQIMEDRTQA